MRERICCLLAVLALAGTTSLAGADGPPLVEDGTAAGKIVTAAEPTEAEQFAAEELQTYLQRITGATLPIVATEDPGEGPAIIVGRHPSAGPVIEQMNLQHPDSYDRLAVVGEGDRLFLTAHSQSGIVWAAWDWLESLGVRWFFPGEHGAYVPQLETVTVPEYAKYDAPAMTFRGPNFANNEEWAQKLGSARGEYELEHGLPAATLWSYRMRFNNNNTFDPADSIPSIGSGHSYHNFLPPERYYDAHPDWFSLVGDRRLGPNDPWQLCFTSDEAAREFAANICSAVARQNELGIPTDRMRLFVSPNDRHAVCECPDCAELLDANGLASSQVLHFANMVAQEVRESYPDAKIVYYVYDNYGRIPDHVTPGPGVYPEIVFWTWGGGTSANHAAPMFSEANDRYRTVFNWFAENSEGLSAHTYYGHYTWFTPWPKLTQLTTDIPRMAEYDNLYGMYSEIHRHWGTQGLTFYLHAKMLWAPDLDVAAALDDYYAKAFGEAGPAIRAHHEALQAQMDATGYIGGIAVEIPRVLTSEVVERCDALMDSAERMLGQMDPATRWRTNLAIEAWRASAKFAEVVRLYTESSGSQQRGRILELVDEVGDFASTETGRWAFENRMVMPALESITSGLRLDLHSLPPGDHVFSDSFGYGGAVKFFAELTGWQPGLWGYSLPAGGEGSIELPVRAAEDHRITASEISWQFAAKDLDLKLSVVGEDGTEHLLAESVEAAAQGISVPEDAMGGRQLVFHLSVTSRHHDPQIVLTGMRLTATVAE